MPTNADKKDAECGNVVSEFGFWMFWDFKFALEPDVA